MNKTSYLGGGIVLILALVALFFGYVRNHSQSPASSESQASTTPDVTSFKAPDLTPAPTAISPADAKKMGISQAQLVGIKFSAPTWSIGFMLRPEWNVTQLSGANNTLHQLQITSSKYVLFISQNEAVAIGGNIPFTTSTRTIAGQNVEVRTYSKVDAPFAYYQMFTLNERDGTYSFLLKSATSDTTVLDTFVKSITVTK